MGSVTQKSPVPAWRAELMEHAVVGVIPSAEVSYSLFSKKLMYLNGVGVRREVHLRHYSTAVHMSPQRYHAYPLF